MTLAVVGGMIDRRVMIAVLLAGEQVQPVQNQRAAWTPHDGANVVAGERRPERDKMKIEGAVTSLMRLGRSDVKGAIALSLDAMVVDASTITDDDLSHRVRPVHILF